MSTCKMCFFAQKVDSQILGRGSSDLVCRRYPPQVNVLQQRNELGQAEIATMTAFPPVRADNWCGEYKPKLQ